MYRDLVEPDTEMTDLVDRYCYVPSMQQQVLVIQPFIRYVGKIKAVLSAALSSHKDTFMVRLCLEAILRHSRLWVLCLYTV